MNVVPFRRAYSRRWRSLTAGEIAMATGLFGDSIDYGKARIYNRRYLPFGLQPRNCAMTPNGAMYFHHSCCLLDFSAGSAAARHWFMHEMVLLWQFAHLRACVTGPY